MWSEDDKFSELSTLGKLGFLYYISNERIGMSGIYECPDRTTKFELNVKEQQFNKIKKELSDKKMVMFKNGWVYVVNAEKHNKYRNSPKNETAYQKEIAIIPNNIHTYFNSSIDSSMHTNPKSKTLNPKSKVINKKPVVKSNEEMAKGFINAWNQVHKTKYVAWKPLISNLSYWLEQYKPEEILQAIVNTKGNEFWKDKMTPVMFLRRRNPRGEEVDYIGEMLNVKKVNKSNVLKV